MAYQLIDDAGAPIDAHFDLEGREIIFHSRGGARGAGQNSDYGPGLRLVLERLRRAGLVIEGAWVDSARARHLPAADRSILADGDQQLGPQEQFRLMSSRMKDVGRTSARAGGNTTKRIRLHLEPVAAGVDIIQALGAIPVRRDFRSEERLPADVLAQVTAEHVWRAVQRLLAGERHSFGASTDFDLLVDDGQRLPPKAVFGLAATEALGFPVLPKHFTGGLGAPAVRILEDAGYEIVPKGAASEMPPGLPPDDRQWAEGRRRLVQHLARERAPGLSKAKKAAFIREHGRLFCERCQVDPVQQFGDEVGLACLEVHHDATRVSRMDDGHRTRLEDLKCLCANCHRVVHAILRRELRG